MAEKRLFVFDLLAPKGYPTLLFAPHLTLALEMI